MGVDDSDMQAPNGSQTTPDDGPPTMPLATTSRGQAVPEDQTADDSVAPVAQVTLASTSRASDAGHLATADIASIATDADIDFRVVGGNAVSLLVWVTGVGELVPDRETNDADLGVPAQMAGADALLAATVRAGYQRTAGNRFARELQHDGYTMTLEIDVLIPSYTDRMESNQPFGDLVVDAIPGLSLAMARRPTLVQVEARLTTGTEISYTVPLPDPISALCMKAYAYRWRSAERDALDIWRLLEVARKIGLGPADWPKSASGQETATIHALFAVPGSTGPAQASPHKANQTRIRALVNAVVRVCP